MSPTREEIRHAIAGRAQECAVWIACGNGHMVSSEELTVLRRVWQHLGFPGEVPTYMQVRDQWLTPARRAADAFYASTPDSRVSAASQRRRHNQTAAYKRVIAPLVDQRCLYQQLMADPEPIDQAGAL